MAQVLAAGMMANAAHNLLPVAANVAQGAAGSLGGAVGSIFGKKGAKIGKKIGSGIVGIGRKLFGFNAGGKVRVPPTRGFKKGGVVKRKGRKKNKV